MNQKTRHSTYAEEIANSERFSFGENWTKFLEVLNEERIQQAVESLQYMLEVDNLKEKSFLDIGSGSGLFSLAAKRLGARVVSFDYDPKSVACTKELKRRYFESDSEWVVQNGSVLDKDYLKGLGKFDVVYSWGVLHHTGSMWESLRNVIDLVDNRGKLFIAIYNDQGRTSQLWLKIKKAYVSLPVSMRWLVLVPCYIRLWGPSTLRDFFAFKPFDTWHMYKKSRGMSPHRDVIDWVGGFPFEVSSPDKIFDFYRAEKFVLLRLVTCAGGIGCNEFVFQKNR